MALWKYGLSCSNQQLNFHDNELEKTENKFRFKETNKNQFIVVYRLGLTQWNLSCFEFKFDDTRLSS